MSTHPNCLLIGMLHPQRSAIKTYPAVPAALGEEDGDDPDVEIGDKHYSIKLMDESYDEDMQVTAPVGSTVFIGMMTYGYGEVTAWERLVSARDELFANLTELAAQTHCTVAITVSANYWFTTCLSLARRSRRPPPWSPDQPLRADATNEQMDATVHGVVNPSQRAGEASTFRP